MIVTDDIEQDSEQEGQGDFDQSTQDETTDGKPYADDFSNLSEERVYELRSI